MKTLGVYNLAFLLSLHLGCTKAGTSQVKDADPGNPEHRYHITEVPYLNVRSGPGRQFPIVGTLKKGDVIQAFSRYQSWLKISDSEDKWLSSQFLQPYQEK